MSSPGRERRRRVLTLLLPYLALVVLHMLSGLQVEQPIILADELGYLGNARYLAGAAPLPDMRQTQFYHFGYSLLLLPAFWVFSDPLSIYKAVIVLNALLASALYFPLYLVLASFLEVPRSTARWIAFTCSLYPSLLLYSDLAWSENAFIPFYAVSVALFGKLIVSRTARDAFFFGVCTGFLYTIHPRGLPVLAVAAASLLLLALLRVLPKTPFLLGGAVMSGVFGVTRVVNGHLKATGWGGGGEFSATKLAGRLLPGPDSPALIENALGQLLYLFQASHGFFLVGLAAVIGLTVKSVAAGSLRRVAGDPRTGVPFYALITALGVFAASCSTKVFSIHGPEGLRAADLIHGRYNEAAAVLFLAFGLAESCRRRLPRGQLAGAILAVAATILGVTMVVAAEASDAHRRHDPSVPEEVLERGIPPANVDAVNVPGVFPLVVIAGKLDLVFMSLATLASFLVLTLAMRFSTRGAMSLLMLLFLLFGFYNYRHYLVPEKARARPRLAFASQTARLGAVERISYDTAHQELEVFHGLQYLLQSAVFDRFDSRRGGEPRSEVVISGNDWAEARRLGARFVVSSGWDNALWVMPGERQSRLPSSSYEDVSLGSEPVFGVQEAGFHLPEQFLGTPGRWTTGAAWLKIPVDPRAPPRMLGIETIAPGRVRAHLRVVANGVELWRRPVPPGPWSKTFTLEQVPLDDELLLELESDTSRDERRLGVVVRGIRLTARDVRAAGAFEGVRLGARYTLGVEESGFHLPETIEGVPGRWTNGRATLWVPLNRASVSRLLAIETIAAGRDGARLKILANGTELWDGRVPREPWSKTLSLEQADVSDELTIELESDTFSPAETSWRSRDERRLGVAIRGIRLTARDRF